MNKSLAFVAGVLLVASFAQAEDAGHDVQDKTTNKTTLMGNKESKHTHKVKAKDANGNSVDAKETDTTVTKKDGTKKTSVKVDQDTTTK